MSAHAVFAALMEEVERLHAEAVAALGRGDHDEVGRLAQEGRDLEGELVFWGERAIEEARGDGDGKSQRRAFEG